MPGEDEDAFPVLSDRSNIVVIADEAHRTQYGFEAKLKIGRKSMSTAIDAANNSTVLQADTSPFGRFDDETETGSTSLDTAIRGMCDKRRLLDIVENFTVFEEARGGLIKKVAKNHQYLGVNKAIAQMIKLRESGDVEAAKRLGVFWHTQGSGKSLSMVFFTQKILRTLPGKWTFLIVTDREELDDQISKTFKATGAIPNAKLGGTKDNILVRAASGDHLKQLLKTDERYIFTLIQKFRTEAGAQYEKLSDRTDIIVITDEAHRRPPRQRSSRVRSNRN
jgi:type I restriction enzyme R subunit